MSRPKQITDLVSAACDGMKPLAASSSAEEVTNALLEIGARGVRLACENVANRAAIRAHLEGLLLETTTGRTM